MGTDDLALPAWALRIREERTQRLWSKKEMANRLLAAAGESATDFAKPHGLARMIAYWETGRRHIHERYRVLYSRVFDVPPAELFAAGSDTPSKTDDVPRKVLDNQVTPSEPSVAPWEIIEALCRSTIDREALTWMEEATRQCAAGYPFTAPAALRFRITQILRRVHAGVAGPQPLSVRQRSVRLIAWLTGLTAGLAADVGDALASTNYFNVAYRAASEAEDAGLRAWLLTSEAIVAHSKGRNADATRLLQEAADLADVHCNPRRRAWITALHARSLAATQHDGATRRLAIGLLDSSHDMLTTVSEPPGGADFFDLVRLEGIRGSTLLHLGAADEADTLLQTALNKRSPDEVKGKALLQLDLARCRVLQGEPDEAERLTLASITLASSSFVQPILTRATEVAGEIEAARHVEASTLYGHLAELERKIPKGMPLEVED